MSDYKEKYNIVLFGKTGNGKSSLGNFLLDRRDAFTTSCGGSSCTEYSKMQSNVINDTLLNVIDTPGLADTSNPPEEIFKRIYDAMSLCSEGFNAFIIVLKFGNRYTEEESKSVELLVRAFGPEFFKIGIVVFTHGDLFDSEELKISFDGWVSNNSKSFKGLFEKCGQNVFLFNNKCKDQKRLESVYKVLDNIGKLRERYLTETFDKHVQERNKISVEFKFPLLTAEVQEKTSLLNAFIEKALANVDDIPRQDIVLIKRIAKQLLQTIQTFETKNGIISGYKFEVEGYLKRIDCIMDSKEKRKWLQLLYGDVKGRWIRYFVILQLAPIRLLEAFLSWALKF